MPGLVVGAVILDHPDAPRRVLAGRRTGPPALAGRWEFPGGKVEAAEAAVDALHRELAEELGVRVELGAPLPGPWAHPRVPQGVWPLTADWVMAVWCVSVRDGVSSAGTAHDQVAWVDLNELLAVAWVDADAPIAAAVLTHVAAMGTEGRPGQR